jgi:hypothetical protein
MFMDDESSENYDFPIRIFIQYFHPNVWPSGFCCDADNQLIQAVLRALSPMRTKIILCGWHVSKNITANCKERWDEFIRIWHQLVAYKTEDEYEDASQEPKIKFNWNNGNINVPPPQPTPMQIQETAEKELERSALVYITGQWLGLHHETSRLERSHKVLKI